MKHVLLALALLLALPAYAQTEEAPAPRYFANVNAGVFRNFTAFYKDVLFDYGAKFGARVARAGEFSQVSVALAFNRNSSNPIGTTTASNTEIMVQPLFTNVKGGSFYFGPQAGINLMGLGSNTTAVFSYGVLAGWAIPVADAWAISPEINLTRFSQFFDTDTAVKALVGLQYAF